MFKYVGGATLALATVLAASCSGGSGPPTPTQIPSPSPSPSTQARSTPSATSTPPPRAIVSVQAGAWLIDYGERDGWDAGSPGAARGAVVALDPASGAEVPGWEPFSAGQASNAAVSPDGSLVAIAWTADQDGPWQLDILDSATGEPVTSYGEFPGLFGVRWSGDGERVYAMQYDVYTNGARGTRIWEFIVRDASSVHVDVDYQVSALRTDPAGRVIPLGFQSDKCCGIDIQGEPFVSVIEAGGEIARIPVPGVVLGQRFEERGAEGSRANILRTPGVALAPDGSRLFIAHADDDAITVVDLQSMSVDAVVTPSERKSALRRFGSWLGGLFVDEAKAKGGAYYTKEASVSPDGHYLYVTGYEPEFCEIDDSFPCVERRPLGLTVIDIESMEIVARHDGISHIAFTPTGARIIGWGLTIDYRPAAPAQTSYLHGPYLIYADTHEAIVAPDDVESPIVGGVGWHVVPSINGHWAFAVTHGRGTRAARATNQRCTKDCYTLLTIDLATGEVVSRRHYNGYIDLISLVPQP